MNDQTDPIPSVTPGQVQIRAALVPDAAALRVLRHEALRNSPDAFGSDLESDAQRDVAFWEGRIAAPNSRVFVAAADSELAGMASISRPERRKLRHSATITGVYVRPRWRGQGVASRLVASCVAWARERELRIVKLAAVSNNTPAIRCYARAGFRVYGVEPLALHHDGVFYNELLMALEL